MFLTPSEVIIQYHSIPYYVCHYYTSLHLPQQFSLFFKRESHSNRVSMCHYCTDIAVIKAI